MPRIHPSANVDSRAEFAVDAEIGPGCLIEGPVTIGPGTRLIAMVSLMGPLTLGRGNTLYPHVSLGFAPQDRKFASSTAGAGTVIGDDNVLREGVTIHRATGQGPTTVGHRNYFMVNSHLGHDVMMGSDSTLANGAIIGGHCELGDQVIVGGNAGVHPYCRLGRLSILSGLSGMVQDLPPFCTSYVNRRVGSLNLIGLRRAGCRRHIDPLKKAFDILFHEDHSNSQAVDLIEQRFSDDPLCMELARFARTTQRGITSCDKVVEDPDNLYTWTSGS